MSFDPSSALGAMGMYGSNSMLSQVPRWNVNDPNTAAAIKAYTSGANVGVDLSGAAAFLRAGPTIQTSVGGDVGGGPTYESMGEVDAMYNLAHQLGIDTDQYGAKGDVMAGNQVWKALDDQLKDYRLITGLTPGQGDNERNTFETLYRQDAGGNLNPVWARDRVAAETGGWARQGAGSEFIRAASLMAPAIGGVISAGAAAGGGAGAAATGAGASGSSSIASSIANNLGMGDWWSGLSAAQQQAVQQAVTSGIKSGLSGGDLSDIIKSSAMGAAGAGMSSMGVPQFAQNMLSQALRGMTSGGGSSAGTGNVGGTGGQVSAGGSGSRGIQANQVQSNYGGNEAVVNALLNRNQTPGELASGRPSAEDRNYLVQALRQGSAGLNSLV